ncbi:MAG TPA: hypothetical protein VMT20_20700 [Terriglobia bacterium]|nr:hypothetical protein [Terriglobia bacterium]
MLGPDWVSPVLELHDLWPVLGAITGNYVDANDANHGFLRGLLGEITTFDAPSAGTGNGEGTVPRSINLLGVITGWYIDASGV